MNTSAHDDHVLKIHRALKPGFGTEAAIYGTILVSGLIAVSSAHDETSLIALITVVVTVIVFWAAHVYAGAVARLGERSDADARIGVRQSLRASLHHSLGMLTSASIPVLILVAGTTRVIPDALANELALWSGTIILAFLGYVAFLRRGSTFMTRIIGALSTASFGVIFILLKAFVH
jgi:hypothetical protein